MTRCPTCRQSFGDGDVVSHCTACHETFTSETLADKHRQGQYDPATTDTTWVKGKKYLGPRRCLVAGELAQLGAVKREVRGGYAAWGYRPREGGHPLAKKETVDA